MSLRFSTTIAIKDSTKKLFQLMSMGFRDSINTLKKKRMDFVDFTGDERISIALVNEEFMKKKGKYRNKACFPYFEFNTDCFDEFSKQNNLGDYSLDNETNHPFMISPELYCRKDPDGYIFTFRYTKDFKAIDLSNWSREEEALFEVANYDVAIMLQVSNIGKSKEFYLQIGFIPDDIENVCNNSAGLILKHDGVPGLKMILWQDCILCNNESEKKGSDIFKKEISYVIMPKTFEDFVKIDNYFLERGLKRKKKYTNHGMQINLGPAEDVHFEILNIKIN